MQALPRVVRRHGGPRRRGREHATRHPVLPRVPRGLRHLPAQPRSGGARAQDHGRRPRRLPAGGARQGRALPQELVRALRLDAHRRQAREARQLVQHQAEPAARRHDLRRPASEETTFRTRAIAGPHRITGILCRWNGININIAIELIGGNVRSSARRGQKNTRLAGEARPPRRSRSASSTRRAAARRRSSTSSAAPTPGRSFGSRSPRPPTPPPPTRPSPPARRPSRSPPSLRASRRSSRPSPSTRCRGRSAPTRWTSR